MGQEAGLRVTVGSGKRRWREAGGAEGFHLHKCAPFSCQVFSVQMRFFCLETCWPNKSLLLSMILHKWEEASLCTGCSSPCIPSSADGWQRGFLPQNTALEGLCITCIGCFILPFIIQQGITTSLRGILLLSLSVFISMQFCVFAGRASALSSNTGLAIVSLSYVPARSFFSGFNLSSFQTRGVETPRRGPGARRRWGEGWIPVWERRVSPPFTVWIFWLSS